MNVHIKFLTSLFLLLFVLLIRWVYYLLARCIFFAARYIICLSLVYWLLSISTFRYTIVVVGILFVFSAEFEKSHKILLQLHSIKAFWRIVQWWGWFWYSETIRFLHYLFIYTHPHTNFYSSKLYYIHLLYLTIDNCTPN